MKTIVISLLLAALAPIVHGADGANRIALPPLSATSEKAYARVKDNQLIVGTGTIERRWKPTAHGLVTVSVKNTGATPREWATGSTAFTADWSNPAILPETASCELVSLTAAEDDDEGFTTRNLKVTAVLNYPAQKVTLRYEIRAFPGSPGLMTQLWVKGAPVKADPAKPDNLARVDQLPVTPEKLTRQGWGIYSNASTRGKFAGPPIVMEEELPAQGPVTWPNGVCLSDAQGGIMMVKESNHTVRNGTKNGVGTNTGQFILGPDGIQNTGWAITPADLSPDTFNWCWASWTITYTGGRDDRELALKQFDRARFPIKKERDMKSFLCGWGDYVPSESQGRSYATEPKILKMIDGCAETGIDMLLIDDGWQNEDIKVMQPKDGKWRPKARALPNGWAPIAQAAKAKKLSLALWAMSIPIPLEDLIWNREQLDLKAFKLDFAVLDTYPKIRATREKARAFVKSGDHRCRVTWDITDQSIPYGYYWNREFAAMHAWNCSSFIYTPSNYLREYWSIASCQNLNKYELSMNNPELVNTDLIKRVNPAGQLSDLKKSAPELFTTGKSDTSRHGIGYCLAMTLMGTPQIWSMPDMMSPEAKAEFIATLAIYKKHQEKIFCGYSFPVGDCPNNAAWTGFQSIDDSAAKSGYLLVFRELKNTNADHRMKLRFMDAAKGRNVEIEDLRTGKTYQLPVDQDGTANFRIEKPADFLFLRYQISPAK